MMQAILCLQATSGANKFITLESHIIEGSTTIANGGIGGSHPYLSGITLPSYVGAVDPNDSELGCRSPMFDRYRCFKEW